MIDYSNRRADHGFTIMELLVVVTIIAMLLALLAPSVRNAFHSTRTAICGGNLRRIGEALVLFTRSDPGGRKVRFSPEHWPDQLVAYVDDSEVFNCPIGRPMSAQDAPQNAPLTDLIAVHVTTRGYDLECIEGPWVAKLSDEQFGAAVFRENVPFHPPPYVPGPDPTIYWYILEDIPNPNNNRVDFEIGIRVAENADGTYTLRVKQLTPAGYNFNVIDKANNRKVLVYKSEMDGTARSERVVGFGGGASYGINAEVNGFTDDVEKIVAMDYPWFVARSTHDWSADVFAGEVPGIPIFARHEGKINVLFTGGSVQLKRPDEINPTFHQATLWDN